MHWVYLILRQIWGGSREPLHSFPPEQCLPDHEWPERAHLITQPSSQPGQEKKKKGRSLHRPLPARAAAQWEARSGSWILFSVPLEGNLCLCVGI